RLGALIDLSGRALPLVSFLFPVWPSGPTLDLAGTGWYPFHPDPAVQSAPVLPAKRSEFVPRSPNQVRSTLTSTAGTQRPITREYDGANTKCTTQISARAGPLDPGRAGRAGRRRRAHRPPVGNRGTTPATRARPKPVQCPRRFASSARLRYGRSHSYRTSAGHSLRRTAGPPRPSRGSFRRCA